METLWFTLLWFMLATYVVLDGFDLGVGALHLLVARSDAERRQVLRSVGPVWDGNEVWLVTAGATMVLAFPLFFATAFSGFYLPLMLVLWLLCGRALGIEMRHQVEDPLWKQFWDVVFFLSSAVLIIVLGAALGNVVRGVSFNDEGVFFEALWTDFRVGEPTGILDWYTVLMGLTALAALVHHGALWLAHRTDAAVQTRSDRVAGWTWPAVVVLMLVTTAATFIVQPHVKATLGMRPWGMIFPLLAVAGLIGSFVLRRRGRPREAFIASSVFLYGMIACVAVGLHPYLLPGRNPADGLTAEAAATGHHGLITGLYWWIPGMLTVGVYTYLITYRSLPATCSIDDEDGH